MAKGMTGVDSLETEISILKRIDPKYWIKLHEVIGNEEDDMVYIIMEYMKQGTLENARKTAKFNKENAWKYFRQIILAVQYCHEELNVIHRDLKPENLLLNDEDMLKLADFGISKELKNIEDDLWKDTAGSNYYMSPEWWLGQQYSGKKADIWAWGVILYQLIHGRYPFEGKTHTELNHSITQAEPAYDKSLSSELLELLQGLLEKDPEKRYCFNQIRSNLWLNKHRTRILESVSLK